MASTLAKDLAQHLASCPVPPDLIGSRKERDFQAWIGGRISAWLEDRLGEQLTVKVESSGGGVEPFRMMGTEFWPDIAIGSEGEPNLLAVEVKLVTSENRPGQISHAIGQAIIYRELYEQSLIAFVTLDTFDLTPPKSLDDKLSEHGIETVQIAPR